MSRFVPHPHPNGPQPYAVSGPAVPHHPPPPQTQPDYSRHLPPPPPPPHPPGCNTCYMDNFASMIQAQPWKIVEALAPHLASMRAEIESVKASVDRVQTGSAKIQQDVSKVQQDISKISTQVSNMGETLNKVVRAQQSSSSATPLDVQSGRVQAKSRDVEMMDNAASFRARPEPSSSTQAAPTHLSPPIPIRDACTTTSPTQRQWNRSETFGRFSKVEWGIQVSGTSQSTPVPVRQYPACVPSSCGSSRSPLNNNNNNNNSSPHASILDHSEEVQQLPSPPEIPTQSQTEEAFVQSQLQPTSQSPSQLIHNERQAETPARPVNVGKCAMPLRPSSSVSSSISNNSTGLFSPISPQIPSLSRSDTLKSIMDLFQRPEEGMPIASFAMTELPDLQYPSQPEIDEEEGRENGGEECGVEKIRSDKEDPFALSSPPAEKASELPVTKELQPQKSMGKKMPLFLPDSEPPSVKSMSPALIIPVQNGKPHSQQPYYDNREDEGREQQGHQVKSPDSSQEIRRPAMTSSDEVEIQLTTLSEIESSSEESSGDDGEEDDGEELDELVSSQEDELQPRGSDDDEGEVDHEPESQGEVEKALLMESPKRGGDGAGGGYPRESGVEPQSGSQAEAARMLIPESQLPEEEEDKEAMEGGQGEIDGGLEPDSQVRVEKELIPQSRVGEEVEGGGQEVDEVMGDVRWGGNVETGSASQAGVERMLLPESQMLQERAMGDSRQENGIDPGSASQAGVERMLLPQNQMEGEVRSDEEDETMEDVERGPEPETKDAADSRGDNIPMTIESSIDKFTPIMEVRDPIESIQSTEEEEQGQGQGPGEFDQQMQVDDDGSQLQFENYHHEAGHLSPPDLSCRRDGLEKSSSGQLGVSVQPMKSLSPLSPSPPHDAHLGGSIEPSPPPSTQVPNNDADLRRESGVNGVMPLSPSEPITPISSMSMRNRTQQEQQQEAEPVALPDYISPVNSPSPSKSPLPVLMRGRKRRFQEMQSLSGAFGSGGSSGGSSGRRKEQVKQVQLVSPTRSGREKRTLFGTRDDASASKSPDGAQNAGIVGSERRKKAPRSSDAAKTLDGRTDRIGLVAGVAVKNGILVRKRVVKIDGGRSEENPICLFSDSSTPTSEVDDEQLLSKGKGKEGEDCIDLTGSPIEMRSQAAKTSEGQGSKGKEKDKETDKDKDKQLDKREEEKKKKEKEKKMMPVGADDSDDAEVIPARAFKAPKTVAGSTSGDEHSNQQRDGRKSRGTTNVPVLNLNGIRDRQNKATTKVKRKTRQLVAVVDSDAPDVAQKRVVDMDGEPPLKRARGRTDTPNAAPVASSSKGGPRRKEPTGDPATKTKWPKKADAKASDRNFVRCDKCDKWYHYGCVGVSMGDDRLKDDVRFICPPCSASGAWSSGEGQRSKRQSASRKSSASEICARPDCSFKDAPDDCEFWVNRIVGRKVRVQGGRGRVEVYLVEWEGYRLEEATWQEEDTMGNPTELIADFVLAAKKEGIDLDRNPNRTVLLKDALAAGWTADD